MRRLSSALMGLSIVTLIWGCDSGSSDTVPYSPQPSAACSQYTSCGSCTPVLGCGWCYFADGSGRCATDPDECAQSALFTWTWNPNGCYVPADASVAPIDVGAAPAEGGSANTAPASWPDAALEAAPAVEVDAAVDGASQAVSGEADGGFGASAESGASDAADAAEEARTSPAALPQ